MRCNKSELIASAHLDQRLTQNEAMKYQAHVGICADCRGYLVELEQVSLILKSSWRPDAPRDLRRHIMSVITAK
jgi:putative zinc finger protein